MSEEMMARMMEKAATDQTFAGGLVAAVGDRQGPEAIKAVAEYGQANGFEVTEAEVAATQTQLIAATETADGDLDDGDLDNVAGGVGGITRQMVDSVFKNLLVPVESFPGRSPVGPTVTDFFKQW